MLISDEGAQAGACLKANKQPQSVILTKKKSKKESQ
jgi:hypothetical protein